MADATPKGHLLVNGRSPTDRQLASVFGCSEKDARGYIKELEEAGVFSRTEEGVIFSRRMVRDKAASEQASQAGKIGGNPNLRRGTVEKTDRVRPYRRSDAPEKTNRIFAKKNGHCWWCDKCLQRETPGPDFFHVDHIVPVCDGGTNDETNLVPACAECNHDRTRVKPTRSRHRDRHQAPGLMSDASDTKHLEAEAEAEAESESKLAAKTCEPSPRESDAPPETAPTAAASDRLHVDGVAIWAALTGDRPALAKSFLQGMLRDAPQGSETALMALLRKAEAAPPPDPRANLATWLRERITPPPPDCPALRNRLPLEKMPRLGDPPNRWADLAQDGRYEVDDQGVSRPVFVGNYIDVAIRAMCEAANIVDPNYRGDFDVPLAWLRDGFNIEQILSVIRAVVARSPGKAISRLKYFDAAVREQRARAG